MVHTPILRLQAYIQNRVVACVITRCACRYIATPVLLNVIACPELSEPSGQLRPGHFNMKGSCSSIES